MTCINVALPGLIRLLLYLFLLSFFFFKHVSSSVSQYHSLLFSLFLTLPATLQSVLLCRPAIQHIKEPWLVQSACRPPVSFTPVPNEKCPLSFSLPPFEVPPSISKRGQAEWLWRLTQHLALLCMWHLLKKDMGGMKGSCTLMLFGYHGNLCFCVGVHRCTGISKTICGVVTEVIKWLASKWAETTVMYISFQGQREIYPTSLQAAEHLALAVALCGLD